MSKTNEVLYALSSKFNQPNTLYYLSNQQSERSNK